MAKHLSRFLAVLVLCLVLAPASALAASFEFGGLDKAVHLHSQGRINFDWAAITGSSSPGDSVTNYFWGANDIRIFDAIGLAFGTHTLAAGDTFTNLDYNTSFWLDKTYRPDILSKDWQSTNPYGQNYYNGWNFYGTMHLTSIVIPDNYTLVLSGQFTNMVNRVTGSSVLTDIANAGTANFSISIVANDRSLCSGLLAALNSGSLSSWADYVGSVGMVVTPVVPEPGTMGMMASALAMGGGMFWRRRRPAAAPAQEETKAA